MIYINSAPVLLLHLCISNTVTMKSIIQVEEVALTAAAMFLMGQLDISLSWWLYVLLFFTPDVSIAAYVSGNKAGAIMYNIFHHRAIAIIVALCGWYLQNDYIILSGLMLLAHASFDRIFGYGLKHVTGFKHTHLGTMK